eukprot:2649047-Rhodomonas_salina.1
MQMGFELAKPDCSLAAHHLPSLVGTRHRMLIVHRGCSGAAAMAMSSRSNLNSRIPCHNQLSGRKVRLEPLRAV